MAWIPCNTFHNQIIQQTEINTDLVTHQSPSISRNKWVHIFVYNKWCCDESFHEPTAAQRSQQAFFGYRGRQYAHPFRNPHYSLDIRVAHNKNGQFTDVCVDVLLICVVRLVLWHPQTRVNQVHYNVLRNVIRFTAGTTTFTTNMLCWYRRFGEQIRPTFINNQTSHLCPPNGRYKRTSWRKKENSRGPTGLHRRPRLLDVLTPPFKVGRWTAN